MATRFGVLPSAHLPHLTRLGLSLSVACLPLLGGLLAWAGSQPCVGRAWLCWFWHLAERPWSACASDHGCLWGPCVEQPRPFPRARQAWPSAPLGDETERFLGCPPGSWGLDGTSARMGGTHAAHVPVPRVALTELVTQPLRRPFPSLGFQRPHLGLPRQEQARALGQVPGQGDRSALLSSFVLTVEY